MPPATSTCPRTDLFIDAQGRTVRVDGGASSGGTTIQDTFNGDGQLVEEVASGATAYDTVSGFDSLGNLSTQGPAGSPTPDTYVYDLKNNMTSATVGGQATAYAYDSGNVLSAETTGGVTTYSLGPENGTVTILMSSGSGKRDGRDFSNI